MPLHNCDLRDRASIEQVFGQYCNTENRVTCVIHFAALKAVGESCREPLKYYQNNVTGRISSSCEHCLDIPHCAGSINLLEVMQSHSVTRLVFSSSATVYGQVSSFGLQTRVPEDYAKFYNHRECPYFSWLKAPKTLLTHKGHKGWAPL